MYAKGWTGEKDKSFFGLNDLQLKILITFIQANYKWRSYNSYQVVLMEFGFAGHSLVGMYNYLVYGLDKKIPELLIMSDIGHDLNGMHDHGFVARTDSYKNMEVNSGNEFDR